MKCKIQITPGGGPPLGQTIWGTFHIIFVFILSSIINHHSSLINHQSSIISHQSSVINHQSSMINDQSSVINYQSSFFRHKEHTYSKSKKERAQKVIPGGPKKKDSSAKSLNDIKKSISRFRSNRTMDRIHGSDPWIGSMDQIHGSDPWIRSMDQIHRSDPWI